VWPCSEMAIAPHRVFPPQLATIMQIPALRLQSAVGSRTQRPRAAMVITEGRYCFQEQRKQSFCLSDKK